MKNKWIKDENRMKILELLSNIYFDEITDKNNDSKRIFYEYKDIIMFLMTKWKGSWEQDEIEENNNDKDSRTSISKEN